jgi:hypothetical protein
MYVFSIDIPFKGRASQRGCQKSQRCHICTLTPLCSVHVTAVSMTPLKFFQNLHCIDIPYKGSQSLAMSKVTAESMTPLCRSQRSH